LPWQTPEYYSSQKKTLRPGTYLRLHENRWTTAEQIFITPELWDGCVESQRSPMLKPQTSLFVGVDAGIKHDTAAVVAVTWDTHTDKLILAYHKIWHPSPTEPLDIEGTIEWYLRHLYSEFDVEQIIADPYQLHRSITTLEQASLPIREFPQTVANTTQMGQCLFDLLTGRNIRLYADPEMRSQALSTVAIENPRGFRIAKEKASKKIDSIVALAMACVAAIERGKVDPDPDEKKRRETVVHHRFDPRLPDDQQPYFEPTIYRG
jgi:phage terminase large subunit-like protein